MDIKIKNKRRGGYLFHYAHFILDCVIPEILENIWDYSIVYRLNTIDQTLGNFIDIWKQLFDTITTEINKNEYDHIKIAEKIIGPYKLNEYAISKTREYIFNQIKDDNIIYPKILLIEREKDIQLIKNINHINKNILRNGKQRRDIEEIDKLKDIISNKFYDESSCVQLAKLPFVEQVNLFRNANLIIMSHGAAMANNIFCKPKTTILEVQCDLVCKTFDKISEILKLKHIKCENNLSEIEKIIHNIY